MARPVQIDDDRILAAAREVFLKQGIQATTAEVKLRGRAFPKVRSSTAGRRRRSAFHCAIATGDAPEWITRLPVPRGQGHC